MGSILNANLIRWKMFNGL